jgi:PAS domain S-box-containing protein
MRDEVLFDGGINPSKDLFARVIAASQDCIKIIGLDGNLLDGSTLEMSQPGRAATQVDDFSALCGLPWAELWPEEFRALILESVARAKSGERSVFEAFCPTANGNLRWWEVTVAPIHDETGGITAILSLSRDISEQQHALQSLTRSLDAHEAQLARVCEDLARESARIVEMRRQLAHSEKVKLMGEFVGHIVHDMNNVLGILASTFRLVQRQCGDTVPRTIFAQGEEAIERGSSVVRQLLDFARGGKDEPEEVDIGAMLLSWHGMLSHLVGRDITLELAIEPGLPSIATRTGALQSVLFNLVANAHDAMPEGGRLVVGVSLIHSAVRGDKLRLFVRDEGIGMPPHVLARAGEPFFSTKGVGKGTGLGLASAFEFARASHGRVDIESVEGKGTTVSVLMPLAGPAPH